MSRDGSKKSGKFRLGLTPVGSHAKPNILTMNSKSQESDKTLAEETMDYFKSGCNKCKKSM